MTNTLTPAELIEALEALVVINPQDNLIDHAVNRSAAISLARQLAPVDGYPQVSNDIKGIIPVAGYKDYPNDALRPTPAGWQPIEREELAKEITRYFAGYSFSKHELSQCLGLVDVLISKNLIAKPLLPAPEPEPVKTETILTGRLNSSSSDRQKEGV